ncbi:hypothetical protein MJO28_016496 [Puccinia striiformis f. sp. tritici]|uniref:Uncharacterized protein n=1 Tax=Puccinia striiformis f. sp. tritici TaxID=168172 RepID=A0ACC0DQ02_9BASI|nr:hypothetical protein MJO28_016496 [Puccinia striiformis f. sp. tritici]
MIRCKAVHTEGQNNEDAILKNPNLLIPHRLDKVMLPQMDPGAPQCPDVLKELFAGTHERARNFQALTRVYNNAVSFTSLGANVDKSVRGQKGVSIFRISGGLSHGIPSVEPLVEESPGFAQIYVQLERKNTSKAKFLLREDIVSDLVKLMHEFNPYAKLFSNARRLLKNEPYKTLALTTICKPGMDPKRYNVPTPEEIGIIVKGDRTIDRERQIRLARKNGTYEYISDMHSSYFPLRYPIFFPYGSQQWDNHYQATTSRVSNRAVGSLEWFAFLLFERDGIFSPILKGRALLQEFVVDSYVVVERRRLWYITNNQTKLKASAYSSLLKSLENEALPEGRRVILPSTFIGSPRAMGQLYQDSMAICRVHGPPSLFITMTANPTWPEIIGIIGPFEATYDHPTLVTRIFYLKVKALLVELVECGRLGKVIAFVWVIEFQKRGLPHLHLMLTLEEKDRPDTPDKVDLLVCAELPDPKFEPKLYDIISTSMIHGPCKGRPCDTPKGCSYGYPKPYTPRTITVSGAYPVYRRRRSEVTAVKNRIKFNTSSVVPYNKYLSLTFNCHINVEVPVDSTAVKYLYKYITKGHDRASIEIKDGDETKAFIDSRYISAPEGQWLADFFVLRVTFVFAELKLRSAAWRLLKLPMSGRSPSVTRLSVHEEGEQIVYFKNSEDVVDKITTEEPDNTTLTAFFELNRNDEIGAGGTRARTLLYEEVPRYFTWQGKTKKWTARKNRVGAIGRAYSVSYMAGEKFYLRTLLLHVRGPRSFPDLRTVDGVEAETYQDACNLLGLLVNDLLYDHALKEAAMFKTGYQLRTLFALMLHHSRPSDPTKLYEENWDPMSDDLFHLDPKDRRSPTLSGARRRVYGLFKLEGILNDLGSSFNLCGLKVSKDDRKKMRQFIKEGTELESLASVEIRLESSMNALNVGQSGFFKKISRALKGKKSSLHYLDGPGGTGKTFLLNSLIDLARTRGKKSVVVASSGVAALLLKGGQTAHSAFKIPIELSPDGECTFEPNHSLGQDLADVDFIVWDEVVTIHKDAIEAVDNSLRRCLKNDEPFGGKVVVFSGDFRQILPVVKFDEFPPAYNATIKSSRLWATIRTWHLTENMRINVSGLSEEENQGNREFGSSLLALGEGIGQVKDYHVVKVPSLNLVSSNDEERANDTLIDFVYEKLSLDAQQNPENDTDYLTKRCILAPLNADVRKLNSQVLSRILGASFKSKSIDVPDPDGLASLPEAEYSKFS